MTTRSKPAETPEPKDAPEAEAQANPEPKKPCLIGCEDFNAVHEEALARGA